VNRLTLVSTLALALAACGGGEEAPEVEGAPTETETPAPESAAAPADSNTLTAQGWGPLRIGMTRAEVEAASGPDANPDAVGGPDPDSCDQFRPANAPEDILVMVENGVLTRISVGDLSDIATDRGFKIGDSAADVKAGYADAAKASPHKYQGPPAEYITVWEGGPRSEDYVQDTAARGIVYEVDGTGNVGAIHVGGPSIQYVEGCL
jgi:hypothetical protein